MSDQANTGCVCHINQKVILLQTQVWVIKANPHIDGYNSSTLWALVLHGLASFQFVKE
jgi:hypothetical protein